MGTHQGEEPEPGPGVLGDVCRIYPGPVLVATGVNPGPVLVVTGVSFDAGCLW